MPTEKELNINLLREKHRVERIKRAALREGATIQDVLNAIAEEEAELNEMLYQNPALTSE
ncbi:MAG: hypothetical protein IJT16_08430 [Lachnospiraceae bacterium]|nr:hypothetical protein [Lachnospiraceae bacterium]